MAQAAAPPQLTAALDPVEDAHARGLANLREFLSEKTCYDILPESFRLIVFDNSLRVKRALTALMTNGVVSAPLYDSTHYRFAGMFTLIDVIHLIQYFYLKAAGTGASSLASSPHVGAPSSPPRSPASSHSTIPQHVASPAAASSSQALPRHSSPFPTPTTSHNPSQASDEPDPYALAAAEVENFPLGRLRAIELVIEAPPPPKISVHPDSKLIVACESLVASTARRLPLIERDHVTGQDAILCVLTQYRTLKFIAINAQADVTKLQRSIGSLGVGSYVSSFQPTGVSPTSPIEQTRPDPTNPFHPLAYGTLYTPVFDVVHMFSERGISAIPIVDENGIVINMFETVDIIDLVRTDAYRLLDMTVGEAITRRSPDFGGITVCSPNDSVAHILHYIGEKRVHRFVIVDDGDEVDEGGGARQGSEGRTPVAESVSGDEVTPQAEQSDPSSTQIGTTATDASNDATQRQPPGRTKAIVQRQRGRLVGMLTLSDVMRHIVGTKSKTLAGKTIVGLGVGSATTQGMKAI